MKQRGNETKKQAVEDAMGGERREKQREGKPFGAPLEARGRQGRREHMPTQLEIVRQVMLMAAQYDSWMTLEELARKTKFAETSISAQLRHLRKAEHGAFEVEKRRRASDEALRTNTRERVWEYQVRG